MANELTGEQIGRSRARWNKYTDLPDEIANILLPDGRPAETLPEAVERVRQAGIKLNSLPEFSEFEGKEILANLDNFSEVTVPILDLRGIKWIGRNLSGVQLWGAQFDWAVLEQIILDDAVLLDTSFRYATLSQASLKNARIERSHLENSNLIDANLESAELRKSRFDEASMEGVHMQYANLTKANFYRAKLRKAQMQYINANGAHFESAYMGESCLKYANLNVAHLEGARLPNACLDCSNLSYAYLHGTDLFGASLEKADLTGAKTEGASFRDSVLQGARFRNASMGELKLYDKECQLTDDEKLFIGHEVTIFDNNRFLPYENRWLWAPFLKNNWDDWWLFNTERWFYTDFLDVRIDDADTLQAPDLYRYVKDQQYLHRFASQHPTGYEWWRWLTGCGDNLWLLGIWSLFTIVVFAFLYWLPLGMIDPEVYGRSYSDIWEPLKWFFVSFDIFTNLGIRATHPQSNLGVFFVFLETTFGFAALGLLIAVANNKWVRRS